MQFVNKLLHHPEIGPKLAILKFGTAVHWENKSQSSTHPGTEVHLNVYRGAHMLKKTGPCLEAGS
jgi:hypothetical protein